MNELISVIVPVYKVEEYLNRCVDSILSQTYKNLEIILVDDGSPDRCGEMCDMYVNTDSRIRVIHKNNGGLSDARNRGIEIAQGKYITFLDSDDWVCIEYIEKLYNLMKETSSDISVSNFIRTSKEDVLPEETIVEIHEFSNIEALEQLAGEFYVQLVVAWGKLYNKDLFNELRYPIGRIHEDEFIAHHLLYRANKVVFTTEQLLYYWQREDSIMGRGFNVRHRHHAAQAYKERADFYEKKGLLTLKDKAYQTAFIIYRQILEFHDENYDERNSAVIEFNSLKADLRRGVYRMQFKIFYELYYVMPFLMKYVHMLYQRLKNILF